MRRPMAWAGAYALLATIGAVLFAAAIVLGPYRAVERSDYMTYHVAARIVLDGQGACLYDAQCQADAQRGLIGEEPSFARGALPFNSPPWLALLLAPLGGLPLAVGFGIFTLVGVAALAWGTSRAAGHAGVVGRGQWIAVVLVMTSWPTVMAIIRGQSTLLVVGVLALSVELARYRSGLALGLSLLKPTLPVLWGTWQILGGHWRAVGTAATVGIAFVLASVLVVSPQAVADYPAHLLGIAGADALGVHVAEMVNWRGAGERLGLPAPVAIVGSLVTLGAIALVWGQTRSRHLGGASAFLATPLVLPHANQHEFVLATVGILLAVAAVPELRRTLAAVAVALHPVIWAGIVLEPQAAAWLLFGTQLGWLLLVVWMSGARSQRQGTVPLPTRASE